MLSLRVSRDKRGYDVIYLLLEARRRGRVENRLLYCGRWPAPCRVGVRPFDDETRTRLEQAHPDVPFDWPALLKTLQAALGMSSRPPTAGPPPPPSSRSRRPGAPPQSGRPGAGAPYRSPVAPPLPPRRGERDRDHERDHEREPLPAEVVLVSAELEEPEQEQALEHEREPDPEFEPVCESDRPFATEIKLQVMTDEIVHLHVPAPTVPEAMETDAEAIPVEGHVFTEASGPATFDAGDADDDIPVGASADADPVAGAGAGAAAGTDEQARRRRRRRRGGRGRGKPPDVRQSSE